MSQKEVHTVEIGNVKYEIYRLAPDKSFLLLCKLFKQFGPSLGAMMDGAKFTEITKLFCGSLEEDIMKEFMSAMQSVTSVNGQPLGDIFTVHFGGKIGKLVRWLIEAFKVQYSDFLDEIRADSELGAMLGIQA